MEAEPDGLAEPHRLALALADALMVRPGDLDEATVAALRATYTPEQLVELTLKVLKFNTQKLNVTLGTPPLVHRRRPGRRALEPGRRVRRGRRAAD